MKEKNKKKKSNKLLNTLICIIILCFLIVGVFYGTYSYMINKSTGSYEKVMNENIQELYDINKKAGSFVKGQSIDPEAAKAGLPDCINRLVALKDKLQAEVPSEKYRSSHENLISGVQNNTQIYRQIYAIFQNPNGNDLNKAVSDLAKYREDCAKAYAQVNLNGESIQLPDTAAAFIANSTSYSVELINIKRDVDAKNSQNLAFSEKIDSIVGKFIPLKTDFSQQLQKIRTGIGSYDDVLILIDQNKEQFLNLKKEFSSVTPSQNAARVYSSFSNVLENYDLFLQELRFAVSNEKLKPKDKPIDEEAIRVLYSSSNDRFSNLEANYDNFLKSFADYKSNNIK